MARPEKDKKRELINADGTFNLAFSYSDIINSTEYAKRSSKENKTTLVLKALSTVAKAKAEFDAVCEYLKATEIEQKKWLTSIKDIKETNDKYNSKLSEIKVQLKLKEKGTREKLQSIDDIITE